MKVGVESEQVVGGWWLSDRFWTMSTRDSIDSADDDQLGSGSTADCEFAARFYVVGGVALGGRD